MIGSYRVCNRSLKTCQDFAFCAAFHPPFLRQDSDDLICLTTAFSGGRVCGWPGALFQPHGSPCQLMHGLFKAFQIIQLLLLTHLPPTIQRRQSFILFRS